MLLVLGTQSKKNNNNKGKTYKRCNTKNQSSCGGMEFKNYRLGEISAVAVIKRY